MSENEHRRALAEDIRRKGSGGRREVALYAEAFGDRPLHTGVVEAIVTRGVTISGSFVPWSKINGVGCWSERRCQNCLREHGPISECMIGVASAVVVDRGGREITAEMLARVDVDAFWDRFGGPAADWLEELEAADAV
jgi:hypothetical protein